MSIKDEIESLKETDIYSMMLFILWKLNNTKEYSTLSELVYVLDKKNFLNLCEYFGGLTITIPTIEQLELIIDSLLLFQYINIDCIDYDDAVKQLGFESSKLRQIKKTYKTISNVLSNYSFSKGDN